VIRSLPGARKTRRLLITSKAWEDFEPELPEAVERAIELLREFGGAVVIREDQAGELVVVRGK
jgi:hypothetical protein